MKQCPNCGNSNNDFDSGCSYCGVQFDSAANNNNSTTGSNFSADNGGNYSTANNNPGDNYNPGSNYNAGNNYSAGSNNYSATNGTGSYNSTDNNYSGSYYQSSAPYQPKTNGFALASLILGIVSIPLLCCCVGVITAILAIIFGFIARNKIMASNGYETGSGMATAGIIIGFAAIGLAIILLVVSLANGNSVDFWNQFNQNFEEQFRKQLEQQQNGLQ
jgi:hypothetical protein